MGVVIFILGLYYTPHSILSWRLVCDMRNTSMLIWRKYSGWTHYGLQRVVFLSSVYPFVLRLFVMKKNKNCIKPNTVVKLAQGQKVTERSRAQIMLIYETSSSSSDQPYKPRLSVSNCLAVWWFKHSTTCTFLCYDLFRIWALSELVTFLWPCDFAPTSITVTGPKDHWCERCGKFMFTMFTKKAFHTLRTAVTFQTSDTFTFAICYHRSVCRLSHCDDGAPFSAGWNSRHFFFAVWYLGHPLTFPSGNLNARGVAKYSDFWHLECYNSETVPDRRKVSINH